MNADAYRPHRRGHNQDKSSQKYLSSLQSRCHMIVVEEHPIHIAKQPIIKSNERRFTPGKKKKFFKRASSTNMCAIQPHGIPVPTAFPSRRVWFQRPVPRARRPRPQRQERERGLPQASRPADTKEQQTSGDGGHPPASPTGSPGECLSCQGRGRDKPER